MWNDISSIHVFGLLASLVKFRMVSIKALRLIFAHWPKFWELELDELCEVIITKVKIQILAHLACKWTLLLSEWLDVLRICARGRLGNVFSWTCHYQITRKLTLFQTQMAETFRLQSSDQNLMILINIFPCAALNSIDVLQICLFGTHGCGIIHYTVKIWLLFGLL